MKHFRAISIKFLTIGVIMYSIMAIFGTASLGNILIITILTTGIAYILGDLFILKRSGNLVATLADFGLAFFSVWALSVYLLGPQPGIVSASIFTAILIGCTEAVFHIYMQRRVFKDDEIIYVNTRNFSRKYQTEFAEENSTRDYIKLNKETDRHED